MTTIFLTVLVFLIQSTLLLAVGLLIGVSVGRNRAMLRQVVFRMTLIAVLVSPVISLLFPKPGVPGLAVYLPEFLQPAEQIAVVEPEATPVIPTPLPLETKTEVTPVAMSHSMPELTEQPQRQHRAETAPGVVIEQLQTTPEPKLSATPTPVVAHATKPFPIHRIVIGFLAIWGLGTLFFLVQLIRSHRRAAAMIRTAVTVEQSLMLRLASCAERLGVKKPVRLLQSPFFSSPCLLGIRKPTVLLPDAIPTQDRELDAILVHELAHLIRSDIAWFLLARIMSAIVFFQPLLWVLKRKMHQASEEICDDEVLRFGIDSSVYAEQLLDVASKYVPGESIPDCVLTMASRKSRLRMRVERILDSSRIISVAVSRKSLMFVAAMTILLTLITGSFSIETKSKVKADDQKPVAGEKMNATLEKTSENGSFRYQYTFSGTVVDAENQPVADAVVDFLGRKGVTDSEGQFSIDYQDNLELNKTIVVITAASADGTLHGYDKAFLQTDAAKKPGSIHATGSKEKLWPNPRIVLWPDLTMTGKVVDSENNPVVDADVFLFDNLNVPSNETKTDEEGMFSMTFPDKTPLEYIYVVKPGAGFDYINLPVYRTFSNNKETPPPDYKGPYSFKLEGTKPFSVKTLGPDGKPLKDAKIHLGLLCDPRKEMVPGSNMKGVHIGHVPKLTAVTDEAGIASIDWFPSWQGKTPFSASFYREQKDRTDENRLETEQSTYVFDPESNEPMTIQFVRSVPFHGIVKNSEGKPVSDIRLRLDLEDKSTNFAPQSVEEDGRFTFSVPEGKTFDITVAGEFWDAPPLHGLKAVAGQNNEELEIIVHKTTRVSGQITFGPEKKPMRNLMGTFVNEFGNERGLYVPGESEDDFVFFAGPGEYAIYVGPNSHDMLHLARFSVPKGRDEFEVNIHLDREPGMEDYQKLKNHPEIRGRSLGSSSFGAPKYLPLDYGFQTEVTHAPRSAGHASQ